jgi:octaprenyl-diphosphate synthase
VKHLVNRVIALGGIEYASKKMNEFRDLALAELTHFPDSPAKNSLTELVHYTIDRKK